MLPDVLVVSVLFDRDQRRGSLPYFCGGHRQVKVVQGQKAVLSPAVSSAMCRMLVPSKLAFNKKPQQHPWQGESQPQSEIMWEVETEKDRWHINTTFY